MKEYIPHIIIALICIALGYFICLQFNKPETITVLKTEYIKGDTVKVYSVKTITVKEKTKAIVNLDTARTQITIDTDSVKSVTDIAFAFIDSTFKTSQTIDCIERSYERVDTVKTFVPVPQELPCPGPRFYQRPMFNFIIGIIVTLVIEIVAVVVAL